MRFLADHMLGSLARWLRFLGFDTTYPGDLQDSDLVRLAKEEKRTLLTRDRELANTKDIDVLYIESTELEKQLIAVLSNYDLKTNMALSRCSICNSLLVSVEKADVAEKVPPMVFEIQNKFFRCNQCDRIYWQGTHYEGIVRKIRELEGKTSSC